MPDHVTEWAPGERSFEGIELINESHQLPTAIAAKIVVDHDETGFPQKEIEGEVLDALSWIAPSIDGKIAIAHDGNIPNVRDPELALSRRIAMHLCVYHGMEAGALQFRNCLRGKDSLREDHHAIVRQPRSPFVQRHTPGRFRGDRTKSLPIRSAKLTPRVVAAMYAEGVTPGIVPEEFNHPPIVSAPVPRDECYAGREPMLLH
jgi:hypothetical protein